MLTPSEESTLLALARSTLETFVRSGRTFDVHAIDLTPIFGHNRATFVTLRQDDGALRGCIGSTAHTVSLIESVRDNTIRSAAHDPRFDAVEADEVDRLTIEISALMDGDNPGTPFREVSSLDEIQIGRDGLYLERASGGGGLLLPQVASERNWNTNQFIEALCGKSGMRADVLALPDTTLYRFGAHVFQE